MLTIRNIIFAACITLGVFIGPARASAVANGGIAPILLAPGDASPTTGQADAWIVRGRIDPARYTTVPAEARDRSRPLWLAATATLTLALAALLPRRATLAVIGVATAWTIGLAIALAARPAVDRVPAADGSLWLIARRPGKASIPIVDGTPYIPIVESTRHWRTLSPHVIDGGTGHATLELTLPAAGARVELEAEAR